MFHCSLYGAAANTYTHIQSRFQTWNVLKRCPHGRLWCEQWVKVLFICLSLWCVLQSALFRATQHTVHIHAHVHVHRLEHSICQLLCLKIIINIHISFENVTLYDSYFFYNLRKSGIMIMQHWEHKILHRFCMIRFSLTNVSNFSEWIE